MESSHFNRSKRILEHQTFTGINWLCQTWKHETFTFLNKFTFNIVNPSFKYCNSETLEIKNRLRPIQPKQKNITVKSVLAYPQRWHQWIYNSKVEYVVSCRFPIHVFILAFIMSREFTHEAVAKFLPAQFSRIWCKCLLRSIQRFLIWPNTENFS